MATSLRKNDLEVLKSRSLITTAIQDGLSIDKRDIDDKAVHRELKGKSKIHYHRAILFWQAYLEQFPGSDPRQMETMKHYAECIGRATKARLDKSLNRPTVKTIRVKVRTFMSAWERHTSLHIPKHVHDSMCPYIEDVLRYKIPLSMEEKAPTFLTIENYVHMKELFWQHDYHNYIHEGVRVLLSALLDLHAYFGARLQEVCMAKYGDLLCMVGWKDNEPDIKLSFKREMAKGMQNTPKKPKHPIYERMDPNPPLFANGMLFLLAIFIANNAFKDYKTVSELLAVRPPSTEKYRILEWTDAEAPIFPQMGANGSLNRAKNPTTWGNQCSNWAMRANFVGGVGLHASRREALIKIDDGGYSLGQVMKFAGHRNSKTLVGHYLDDMSNVDGAAAFLNLNARRNVTEDFRSASMKRNPGLRHSLPAKVSEELQNRPDYITLCEEIKSLSVRMKSTQADDVRKELKIQLDQTYFKRRQLRETERTQYLKQQKQEYDIKPDNHDGGDWRRSYFGCVVRLMNPTRARLAQTLSLTLPLRSTEGIAALEDLISLVREDCRVTYDEAFRPTQAGCCPVRSCSRDMESIEPSKRWDHVFHCYRKDLERLHGFAEFCFQCREWVTNTEGWQAHCQNHIDAGNTPFRCKPMRFRHAIACTGLCPVCLGNKKLSSAKRMRQWNNISHWRSHVRNCVQSYVENPPRNGTIPCPHPLCTAMTQSEEMLWHHLEDNHSIVKPDTVVKRQLLQDEDSDFEIESSRRKRPKLELEFYDQTANKPTVPKMIRIGLLKSANYPFVNVSMADFEPCLEDTRKASLIFPDASSNRSSTNSVQSNDNGSETTITTLSSLSDNLFGSVEASDAVYSSCSTLSAPASVDTNIEIISLIETGGHKSPEIYKPVNVSIHSMKPYDPQHQINSPAESIPMPNSSTSGLRSPDSTLHGLGSGLRSNDGRSECEKPSAVVPEDDQYYVDKIMKKGFIGRRVWYRVKWLGYPDSDNSWIKKGDIDPKLIADFESTVMKNEDIWHCGRLVSKKKIDGMILYEAVWQGQPQDYNILLEKRDIPAKIMAGFDDEIEGLK
ncbi:hypothetical protein BX600DRAFT_525660 [Xylariales sp. PMI_506]|nr:hypothetical protein BX600DRAFT_525660 [Xylariales sp. PMI_506]